MKIKERLCQWGRFIRDNQNGLFKIAVLLMMLNCMLYLWEIRDTMPDTSTIEDSLNDIRLALDDLTVRITD